MNVAVVEKERLASPEKHESVLHHIPLILEQEVEAQRIIDRAVGAKVNPQIEGPRDDS